MKPTKAREILDLNVKEAGKKMPADTLEAVKLGSAALTRILSMRSFNIDMAMIPLPGENPVIDTSRSEHTIKRLLESPYARDPKE